MTQEEHKEFCSELTMRLVKEGVYKTLGDPEVGCAVLYFKGGKLIYAVNVDKVYPEVIVKVLDEKNSQRIGFPVTDLKPLNWIDYDEIIYVSSTPTDKDKVKEAQERLIGEWSKRNK